MDNFKFEPQKEVTTENVIHVILSNLIPSGKFEEVLDNMQKENLTKEEMCLFVKDFYGNDILNYHCNHIAPDCNIFEYTYSNGVKTGVKCKMCNHKMKVETYDLAVRLGLASKNIIDINKEEESMKKYLILGEFNNGASGMMYAIINAENDLEAMKKVEKTFEDEKINTDIISVMNPIEITDADQLNFVIPSGITELDI